MYVMLKIGPFSSIKGKDTHYILVQCKKKLLKISVLFVLKDEIKFKGGNNSLNKRDKQAIIFIFEDIANYHFRGISYQNKNL